MTGQQGGGGAAAAPTKVSQTCSALSSVNRKLLLQASRFSFQKTKEMERTVAAIVLMLEIARPSEEGRSGEKSPSRLLLSSYHIACSQGWTPTAVRLTLRSWQGRCRADFRLSALLARFWLGFSLTAFTR